MSSALVARWRRESGARSRGAGDVRALVHVGTPASGLERMLRAAAGLERRGHAVLWHGAGEREPASAARGPEPPEHGDGGSPRAPGPPAVDVVIGSARSPLSTAWLGWKAGAHCMVLALEAERVRRWGPIERWACHSLYTAALAEPAEREALRAHPGGLELPRIG